jgi:diketogulonate reductase-like aldo/keto reductase
MWNKIKLNDERYLPEIGFGSWQSGSGQSVLNQIQQAFNLGFIHFDTAQIYNNEKEVGQVLSKLNRNNYWLTTKWSAKNGKGIQQSIQDSLSNLNLTYVDLYLIHVSCPFLLTHSLIYHNLAHHLIISDPSTLVT